MAGQEDAATVLEQFCNDVANLPAEISHLLEEVTAKDQQIEDLRNIILSRDRSIQNFVRQNGGHIKNPREESLAKGILASYDRIEALQAQKLALSEKAMVVLDRQIKRFDLKMRKLEAGGELTLDPTVPSLLTPGAGSGTPSTGTMTPMNPITTAQVGGGPNIANAAIARMAAANSSSRNNSPASAPNALLNQPHLNASAPRSSRESSADAAKRRRLNTSLSGNIPTQSSALRQSSMGPTGTGTPKAGTPVPASSRAGSASAQPARPAAATSSTTKKAPTTKKVAPHQAAAAAASRKRIRAQHGGGSGGGGGSSSSGVGGVGVGSGAGLGSSSASLLKKGDRRRNLSSPTPSSSRGSMSPTPSSLPQHDGASDIARSRRRAGHATSAASDDEPDEPEQDAEGDEIYCICQQVSYGDMVACDNEECPYQWFHWVCVGLKAEPKGDWLCPHCRDLPSDKIVKAKDEK